jgi:murein DD-endopeptidase MepM/ murein hydrolase activator NlpD
MVSIARFMFLVSLMFQVIPAHGDAAAYAIKEGETLFSIARRAGIPVEVLCTLNGIKDPDKVKAGTIIRFPESYVVKKGDTLYSIARAYSTSVAEIQTLNRLAASATIKAGDSIYIPTSGGHAGGADADAAGGGTLAANPTESSVLPHPGPREQLQGKNPGLVFHGARGDTVVSASEGEVRWVGNYWSWGKAIIIRRDDGLQFFYAGNGELLVNVGDRVRPGTEIAHLGVSPQGGGALLYFSIHDKGGKSVDPEKYFSKG